MVKTVLTTDGISGRSITPLLKNTDKKCNYPVLTTMGYNRHAVRDDRYRYIRYDDSSEELYDHQNDSREWTNLADRYFRSGLQ